MDPKRRCVVLSFMTFFCLSWCSVMESRLEGAPVEPGDPETDQSVSGSTPGAAQGKKRREAERASFRSSNVSLVKQEPDPLLLEEPRSGPLLSNVT